MTDRFATTDGSSVSCDTTARKHCGGTWQGVIRQLDYIQSLGFDAVLISPVVKNIEGETPKGEAYHGFVDTRPTKDVPITDSPILIQILEPGSNIY